MSETINNSKKINSLQSIDHLRSEGVNPYPDKFTKKINIGEISKLNLGDTIETAGRIVLLRNIGKITFAHIQDFSGRMQIAAKEDILGKEKYKWFSKTFDTGDFIGIKGQLFETKTGEK